MAEQMSKATLLANMNRGYTAFEKLLASLNETQLTMQGVNSGWSVKDNIAHVNAWHRRAIDMLQATRDGVDLPDPTPDLTVDEVNERFYQQDKDRSLNEVLAEFHSTYQQLLEGVQATSEEDLNKPLSWLDGQNVWPYVAGNSYEHYQEHADIIQAWLAKQ